jgi:hypothetical protein
MISLVCQSRPGLTPFSLIYIMTLFSLLFLYLAFRLKQVSCDFILQTGWMALNKGNPGWEGYKPLFAHTSIHAAGTLIIFLIFCPALWWFCFVDFIVHSLVDRLKAVMTLQQNWTPGNWKFWWSFGLDQEAHNLTHLVYILVIISALGGVTV